LENFQRLRHRLCRLRLQQLGLNRLGLIRRRLHHLKKKQMNLILML
jgi:hypothetical protein